MAAEAPELVEVEEAAAVLDRLTRSAIYEAHLLHCGGMAGPKAAQVAIEGALGAAIATYRAACITYDEAADETRLAKLLASLLHRPVGVRDARLGPSWKPH